MSTAPDTLSALREWLAALDGEAAVPADDLSALRLIAEAAGADAGDAAASPDVAQALRLIGGAVDAGGDWTSNDALALARAILTADGYEGAEAGDLLLAYRLLAGRGAGGSAPSPYRVATLDNAGGAAKTDHPVKIVLTSANFDFSQIVDGTEFRFTAADGSTALSYWREAVDVGAGTATLWVRVPSIGAGATATVRLYWDAGEDGSAQGDVFLAGFDTREGYDALRGRVSDPGVLQLWGYDGASAGVLATGTGLREHSPVYLDPAEADAAKRYKFYYTDDAGNIHATFSADGETWVAAGAVIDVEITHEDPYLLRDAAGLPVRIGGLLHLYCERGSTFRDIVLYTSADGEAWTFVGSVLAAGASGAFDGLGAFSPVAIYTGDVVYLIYEGINLATTQEAMGLATASDPAGPFTKVSTDPLIAHDAAPWSASSVVIDDAVFVPGERWVLFGHSGQTTGGDGMGRMTTTVLDPAEWDDLSFEPWGGAGTDSKVDPNVRNDLTVDFSSVGADGLPQRLVTGTNDDAKLVALYVSGAAAWRVRRHPASSSSAPTAFDGSLVFEDPEGVVVQGPTAVGGSNRLALVGPDLGRASGFEILVRMRDEAQANDLFSALGFGANADIGQASDDGIAARGVGHAAVFYDPGNLTNGFRLHRYDASNVRQARVMTALAEADARAWNVRRLSYLGTGALSAVCGGSSVSATDANALAGSKAPYLSVTPPSSPLLVVAWLAVRPCDGVDPAVTVGEETA